MKGVYIKGENPKLTPRLTNNQNLIQLLKIIGLTKNNKNFIGDC